MKKTVIILLLISCYLLEGCSAGRSLVIRSVQPFFDDAMTSLLRETDPDIARAAMASDLKLLEGMLVASPANTHLLTLASQGFAGYSMLYYDPYEPEKAKELYRRSLKYGKQALSQRNIVFGQNESRFEEFEKAIETLHNEDIKSVYWTAIALAGWINLSRTDALAIAEFPRARLLMEWVNERDENYFFSGPNWFYGVYYSTLPPIVGGDAKKSKVYFDKAIKQTDGKFLWGKLLYAQTYAVQTLDRNLFDQILTEIINAESDELPDANLLNQVAKERAKILLGQGDELF